MMHIDLIVGGFVQAHDSECQETVAERIHDLVSSFIAHFKSYLKRSNKTNRYIYVNPERQTIAALMTTGFIRFCNYRQMI